MSAEPYVDRLDLVFDDRFEARAFDRRVAACVKAALDGTPAAQATNVKDASCLFRSLIHEPRPVHRVAVAAACASETAVSEGCGFCVACQVFDGLTSYGRLLVKVDGSVCYLLKTGDAYAHEYIEAPSKYVKPSARGHVPFDIMLAEQALNAASAQLPPGLKLANGVDPVLKLSVAASTLITAAVDLATKALEQPEACRGG